ncbi:MAG: ATP-binding cassette domain-containing protein [Candidatus Bathyarchaeia archaeon]
MKNKGHKHEYFHIKSYAKTYDKRSNTFTINITYETATEITPRTIGVAEAFGLGIDQQQKFTIYDNLKIKITPKDIVYITGESGSGKSTLLKAMRHDLNQEAIDIAEIQTNPEKPIIDTIGKNLNQALELLSRAGLNDAFLFTRRFNELSDGQKYRYKIAKLMESNRQWWLADEFCSTLDRDTAKIVAFNLQKIARQTGKAVVVATTHTDLLQDLKPNIHIHKRFGRELTLKYYPNNPPKECSITKEMRMEEGTPADYKRLSIFHYRSSRCPPPRKIFALKRGTELCGVIVYSYPPPLCFGRSRVWRGNHSKLQREISTISRVVVHPKYRTIGLGVKLVKETLAKAGTPYVETLAVMAKYNPFFEKAGMKRIAESKPNQNILEAIEKLRQMGFNPIMLGSQKYNMQKIMAVGKSRIFQVLEELSKKEGTLRKRLVSLEGAFPKHLEFLEKLRGLNEEGLAAALKRLSFLAQTKVYLFWRNENHEEADATAK